jgi:hypothetical protein
MESKAIEVVVREFSNDSGTNYDGEIMRKEETGLKTNSLNND